MAAVGYTASGLVPADRLILAGTGLSGGGDLAADRTLSVVYGSSAGTAAQGNDARLSDARTPTAHAASHATLGADPVAAADIGAVPTSRQVIAGTGLTGGGTLAADRTLTVAYGSTSTTVARGDDARLSDQRTPTDASVTDAKVAGGAAIALSKLAVDPLARANHTGTQAAATVSDFATAVAATALTKANNLSDLANAGTARTNLSVPPTSRLITAGAGLTGGGDLSADRTLGITNRDALLAEAMVPAGRYETRSRLMVNINTTTVVSGALYLVPIWLPSGLAVAFITFTSGTVAAVTPTNQWFALMDSSRVLLALTSDDTTTAWAANTVKTKAIATVAAGAAASYSTTYTGLHFLGFMVAAATPPSFLGGGACGAPAADDAPAFGAANTGLTTPPAFAFTANAPTGTGVQAYGYVTA